MPFSIILLTIVLAAISAFAWFAARDARGRVGTAGRTLSVVGMVAAALVFFGALTAGLYGGRPFGLETLKRPYDLWLERFENPTRPLV
jgi:hypothetical protein